MRYRSFAIVIGFVILLPTISHAQSEDLAPLMFKRFVLAQGRDLRANDVAPSTRAEWEERRAKLRTNLVEAWGGFPATPCPLEPRKFGEIQREGYRVEKIVFQTLPGVWMTANAYVPNRQDKVPAVLCVHGHWAGAKQDPVVQSRCIGLAKLGFFVLSVDAFGAGERAVGKRLGEYHGEMTAATLFPVGRPLSGLQVYENMRAVDYLQSRPEIDPSRVGITGASGGGNQTMYAGAFDERFRSIVPTCSVGNYQAYLNAACCMCEVVPGALRFTEEGDVLGLAAARGLMVTSATKDAFQFSVDEAKKSFERAAAVAKLYESAQVKHTIIESPHHYNQPMREAMYGWMTLHLKDEGDGSPIPEPEIKTEDPEALRCYPGESRPDDYVTIPRFAAMEARQLLAKHIAPGSLDAWKAERTKKLAALESVLGGRPKPTPLKLINAVDPNTKTQALYFESEPGVPVIGERASNEKPAKVMLLLDLDGHVAYRRPVEGPALELAKKWEAAGWTIVRVELRASGKHAPPGDKIGNAPDHNSAEWSLWIGRPLLGQWVWDVLRMLDALAETDDSLPKEIAVVGIGTAGPVALCAAALDERISHAMTLDSLSSYVTDEPYRDQRLGVMAPGILRDVGDIAHIASLIAPRKVTIVGGITGGGKALDLGAMMEQFAPTRAAYSLTGSPDALTIVASGAAGETASSSMLPSREKFHLYLLIGQSNMAGRGAMQPDAKAPVRVLKLDKENRWVPASDPLHFDKPQIAGVGPGSSFGPAMADADESITIGLIPCAVGGTPLKRWEAKGDLYQNALIRTREAMKSGTLRGVIWHQGEADSGNAETANSYGERLAGMIAQLRKDIGQPNLPVVVGQLPLFTLEQESSLRKIVNAALVDLPNRLAHTACVEVTGLKHKGDNIHFDADSARELGQRYATAMKALLEVVNRK